MRLRCMRGISFHVRNANESFLPGNENQMTINTPLLPFSSLPAAAAVHTSTTNGAVVALLRVASREHTRREGRSSQNGCGLPAFHCSSFFGLFHTVVFVMGILRLAVHRRFFTSHHSLLLAAAAAVVEIYQKKKIVSVSVCMIHPPFTLPFLSVQQHSSSWSLLMM